MNNLTPVSAIMRSFKDIITVSPEDSLVTIQEILKENRFHHIPVINKHKLVGIFSKTDFFRASLDISTAGNVIDESSLSEKKVSQYMTEKMVKIQAKERVDVAALLFKENRFHCLPIVNDENELEGIITPFDIIKHSFKLTQVY
ncbi:MAG: CBS domain-containing protein [Saprospiraceae bacterium]